jgi:hypothetical protein
MSAVLTESFLGLMSFEVLNGGVGRVRTNFGGRIGQTVQGGTLARGWLAN